MTVVTIMGDFDRRRFENLKKLYEAAHSEQHEIFVENWVEGMGVHRPDNGLIEWSTRFAMYMLEFLTPKFKR